MKHVPLIAALAMVLGFAWPDSAAAAAASAIATPPPSLVPARQVAGVQQSHIRMADVGFRLYIGPRYRYYRYRYPYYRYRYRRHRRFGRCRYWSRRCIRNWGYRNSDYYGCMRYYGCR